MKNVISGLIILFTFILESNAQSTKLDEKNGFNKFILGSRIDEVKKLVKIKKIKFDHPDKNYELYEVTKIEDFRLFNYSLSRIELFFYKGLLLQISVDLPSFRITEDTSYGVISIDIRNKIEAEYGPWIRMTETAEDIINNVNFHDVIKGNLVLLYRVGYNGKKVQQFDRVFRGDRYTFISIPLSKTVDTSQNGL